MNLELFGFILDTIGTLMVAYTVIVVHYHVWNEHKIDAAVFKAMRREQIIGVVGIILIVIGFVMQLPSKL